MQSLHTNIFFKAQVFYLCISLCLLVFLIKIFNLFCIKKILISNFLFKIFLGLFFLFFIYIKIEDYFFIVSYFIYIAIISNFIFDDAKVKYLTKILFIILFWSLLFNAIDDLFIDTDIDYNLEKYLTYSFFLAYYTESFDALDFKEIINDLIKKIESLNLSKKSILDQNGGSGGGPDDPDPKILLDLLNDKNEEGEEFDTIKQVIEKHKFIFINNTVHTLCNMSFSSPEFHEKFFTIENNNLIYEGETFNIPDLNHKIEKHNENLPEWDIKNIKKEWCVNKGNFPDIYTYINGGFTKYSPVKEILPNYFLVKQYFSLNFFSLEFNTLLLTKLWLENNSLNINNDLAKNSNDYWLNRQVLMAFNLESLYNIMDEDALKIVKTKIWNPLNNKVYENEVLENILYVGLKILEHHWTITYLKDHYSFDSLKNLTEQKEIIDFYNKLYFNLKKEVYNKNKKEYNLYKEIWKERYTKNHHFPRFLEIDYIKTPLTEETFIKTPSLLEKEWKEKLNGKFKFKSKLKLKIPKFKKPKIKFLFNKFKSK
uniref:Uncharacterized protein n=1 Tax=Cordyceps cicadae TaxID=218633 RepID=A0A481S1Q6_9HYPO|nr:hypothetical protein [Cordyceps cicadae]QBG64882.1 hypothetical protein [Cordyceps cicadae]QBG64921.1 hypothetical protein [Cordyceps cicadae]QZM06827.1 hypothetical protein [Cordyceps chanhua]